MTLEELLKRNAEIKAAREKSKQDEVARLKQEEKSIYVEPNLGEEGKKENEEIGVESKRKGKKPANREYMVVEEMDKEIEIAEEKNMEDIAGQDF